MRQRSRSAACDSTAADGTLHQQARKLESAGLCTGPPFASIARRGPSSSARLRLHDQAAAPKDTYFDRTISPILQDSCVRTNTGANCHVDAEPKGNAIGNLSLDVVRGRRRSGATCSSTTGRTACRTCCSRTSTPFDLISTAYDGTQFTVATDIRHSGVETRRRSPAPGFNTLQGAGSQDGATKNNAITPAGRRRRATTCSTSVPQRSRLSIRAPTRRTPDFADVQDQRAAHRGRQRAPPATATASPSNSLRLVCAPARAATTDVLARWNYFAASAVPRRQHDGRPRHRARSCGVRSIPRRAASYHEGGAIFARTRRPGLRRASRLGHRARAQHRTPHGPPGFEFFAKRVQPMLVEEGVHDSRVPLAGDVPRLPPARRKRRQLQPADHAHQLRAHARSDRDRVARPQREPPHRQESAAPDRACSGQAAASAPRRRAARRFRQCTLASPAAVRHTAATPRRARSTTSTRTASSRSGFEIEQADAQARAACRASST